MNKEFYIGKTFEGIYPSEAAGWCKNNNAKIIELESSGDVRRFQIVEIPEYVPTKEDQIEELKEQLASTDYKIIKCSECSLAGEELPYDIAELHTERQALRDQINELEAEDE